MKQTYELVYQQKRMAMKEEEMAVKWECQEKELCDNQSIA